MHAWWNHEMYDHAGDLSARSKIKGRNQDIDSHDMNDDDNPHIIDAITMDEKHNLHNESWKSMMICQIYMII